MDDLILSGADDFMDFLGEDLHVEESIPEEEVVEEVTLEEEEFDEVEEDEIGDDDDEEIDSEKEDVPADEFEITVDGETIVVTKEELQAGYVRDKDYKAKMAEIESKREAAEKELATTLEASQVFGYAAKSRLAEFEKCVEAEGGWLNMERTRDPVQVAKFKEMYQMAQNEAKLSEDFLNEHKAKMDQSYQEDMTKVVQHMYKTIPNVTKETFEEMDKYVAEVGLPVDMVKSIRDPIAWSLIHKAMMYDKAQSRVKNKPDDQKSPKRVVKSVNTRREVPSASNQRKLDKTITAMRNTTDRSAQSQLAQQAFAQFI